MMRLSEAVSLFVLEDGGLLFDEARQRLIVLDGPETFLWCCLKDGVALPEIHRRYAETFGLALDETAAVVLNRLLDWQRAGYCAPVAPPGDREHSRPDSARLLLVNPVLRRAFATDPHGALESIRADSAARDSLAGLDPLELEHRAQRLLMRRRRGTSRSTPVSTHDAGRATLSPLRTSCRLLDTEFRLTFPRALAERIRGAFEHLPGDGDGDVQVEIRFSANGLTTLVDGVPEDSTSSEDRVVPQVRKLLRRIAIHRADPLLVLEAGMVMVGSAGLLLPGPPGCGKTLLTAALLRAGARFGSDAVTLLERGTGRARPVALDLAIKEGGVGPLEDLFPGVADLPIHAREDGKRVRYLAPPADGWRPIEGTSVRWMVFPRFVPDRTSAFSALSGSAALCALLENCVAEPGPLAPAEIGVLASWIATVQCHELRYRSLAEATLVLRRLVSSA